MQKASNPTDRELQVLKILWDCGPSTVQEVHQRIGSGRAVARNTTQTFLRMMTVKGFVSYEVRGRSFVYTAIYHRSQAVRNFIDLVFDGSIERLLITAFAIARPTAQQWIAIEDFIRNLRASG